MKYTDYLAVAIAMAGLSYAPAGASAAEVSSPGGIVTVRADIDGGKPVYFQSNQLNNNEIH